MGAQAAQGPEAPRPEAGPSSGSLGHGGCDFITVTRLPTPLPATASAGVLETSALCLGLAA